MLVMQDLIEYTAALADVIGVDPPRDGRATLQLMRVIDGLLDALADPPQLHIAPTLYLSMLTGCRHSEVRYIRTHRLPADYEIVIWQLKQERERRIQTTYQGAAIVDSLLAAVDTYGVPSRTAISRWMRRRAAHVRALLPSGMHNASHLCRHIHVSVLATVWRWSRQRLAEHMDVASSTIMSYLVLLGPDDLPIV